MVKSDFTVNSFLIPIYSKLNIIAALFNKAVVAIILHLLGIKEYTVRISVDAKGTGTECNARLIEYLSRILNCSVTSFSITKVSVDVAIYRVKIYFISIICYYSNSKDNVFFHNTSTKILF